MVNVVVVDIMAVAADDEGDITGEPTNATTFFPNDSLTTDNQFSLAHLRHFQSVLTPSLVFVFGRMRIVGLNDFWLAPMEGVVDFEQEGGYMGGWKCRWLFKTTFRNSIKARGRDNLMKFFCLIELKLVQLVFEKFTSLQFFQKIDWTNQSIHRSTP